jgi:hypothetical protein
MVVSIVEFGVGFGFGFELRLRAEERECCGLKVRMLSG